MISYWLQKIFSSCSAQPVLWVSLHDSWAGLPQLKHLRCSSESGMSSLQISQFRSECSNLLDLSDFVQSQILFRICLSSSLVRGFSLQNGNVGTGLAVVDDSSYCLPESTPSPPAVRYSCFTGPISKFCAVISHWKLSFSKSNLCCLFCNLSVILPSKWFPALIDDGSDDTIFIIASTTCLSYPPFFCPGSPDQCWCIFMLP